MTTRPSRAPNYADLAKASASVKRELAAHDLGRLAEVVEGLDSVQLALHFSLDGEQRIRVKGAAQAHVVLACQLCTEPVARTLELELEGLLAASEDQAELWREAGAPNNIIVVASAELDPAELVEDELLLSLPSQVCIAADCERRPELSYGPLGDEVATDTYKPFAALAEMRSAQTDDSQQSG